MRLSKTKTTAKAGHAVAKAGLAMLRLLLACLMLSSRALYRITRECKYSWKLSFRYVVLHRKHMVSMKYAKLMSKQIRLERELAELLYMLELSK